MQTRPFIEGKSAKGRSPPKQGLKRVNGNLLPTKATQIEKRKKPTSLTIKEMFQITIMLNESVIVTVQFLVWSSIPCSDPVFGSRALIPCSDKDYQA
ncbi:hypothetical protein AVEN_86095-1 [Araneus ventricosus]|uniref:Uncharacterized protein n=1 Tax=Araneus ventricosus TaxID=182803 RepID=A0A4Y2KL52_ARAVE|nr:hypothetical protein AVEN_86095-1 [Araneus ventricosus]